MKVKIPEQWRRRIHRTRDGRIEVCSIAIESTSRLFPLFEEIMVSGILTVSWPLRDGMMIQPYPHILWFLENPSVQRGRGLVEMWGGQLLEVAKK